MCFNNLKKELYIVLSLAFNNQSIHNLNLNVSQTNSRLQCFKSIPYHKCLVLMNYKQRYNKYHEYYHKLYSFS